MAENLKMIPGSEAVSRDPAPQFPLPDDFPLMFHVTDLTGTIVRVSDDWLSSLGYSRQEVIGRKNLDFLTDDSAADARLHMKRFFDHGRIEKLQREFLKKDGDILSCELSATLLESQDGGRVGAVAMLNPVSGAEPLVQGLRRKSFRLQSCLEGTNAGTWEWNVQTGEAIFNERWAEIVGYTLAELSPISIDTWLSLAHPDDLAKSGDALQKHWDGETDCYDLEARMRHKDGHWVWVHDRGRVFTRTPDGKPEWMFGTHFSLDEQRRRMAERARMQRLLSRTGEVAGVGGWEIDLEAGELIWTAETRRIHGVDEDYVPNIEEGIEFYAPEARGRVAEAVEAAMRDGSPWDLELPFIRKSGERIWVRAVGDVEFLSGKPRRIYGAFQDITERVRRTEELKDAIAALERSNEELDQFAYIASHDLKAPLRVIANAAGWIEQDVGDALQDETRKAMNLLKNRVARMDKLLCDLLEHSRIGRIEEDTSLVTMAEILGEVRDLVDRREGFTIVAGDGLDKVTVPRMPATKILLNLVGNAVKHHDRDTGTVWVEAAVTGDEVTLTVSDDGPGIPEDMQDRVFGLFQTLRPRDQVEGSGMGLAIIEKSVATAGGRVQLVSEGRGCVFTIKLPLGPGCHNERGTRL